MFVKANEKYGREDMASISCDIEGKTPEEVMLRNTVFFFTGTPSNSSKLQCWGGNCNNSFFSTPKSSFVIMGKLGVDPRAQCSTELQCGFKYQSYKF